MSTRVFIGRCLCGYTRKLKPEEVPDPGKCLPCRQCRGILKIEEVKPS